MIAKMKSSKRVKRCGRKRTDASTAQVLLLSARQAATLFGKSVRTWRTWDGAGLVPRPIQIGRSVFWRADELKRWISADCPPRAEWDVLRQN